MTQTHYTANRSGPQHRHHTVRLSSGWRAAYSTRVTTSSNDTPALSRRTLLHGAGVAAGVALTAPLARIIAQAPAAAAGLPIAPAAPSVPDDATRVPGVPTGPLGERSPFEKPMLAPVGVTTGATNTPHQNLFGTITPSDLHFQQIGRAHV